MEAPQRMARRRTVRRDSGPSPYSPLMTRPLLSALTGLAVFLPFAHSQQFADKIQISQSLADPRSPEAADIDGDGDQDLLLASFPEAKVLWVENAGGTGAGPLHEISSDPDLVTPEIVRSADLDGDGDMDVVVAGSGKIFFSEKSVLYWFENQGDGSFGPAQLIQSGSNNSRQVALADMDNDGDVDILSDVIGIRCFLNDGQGQFTEAPTFDSQQGSPAAIVPTDIDGDGLLDIVIPKNGTTNTFGTIEWGRLFWYRNEGGGAFGDGTKLVDSTPITTSAAADLDSDGDVDLLVSRGAGDPWTPGGITWLRNLGSGDFDPGTGPQQPLIGVWSIPFDSSVTAASLDPVDVNADGHVDLLCANRNQSTVTLYTNPGDGSVLFGSPTILTSTALEPWYVLGADLNGDQLPDVVTASFGDDQASTLINQGSGLFSGETQLYTTAAEAQEAVPADMDGDGDLDVLFCSFGDNKVGWRENLGGGALGDQQIITTALLGATSVQAYDFDLDGDLDVLATGSDVDTVAWIANLGSGQLWGSVQVINADAESAEKARAMDMDGDGDLDVYSLSAELPNGTFFTIGGKMSWYENLGLGSGAFGPEQFIFTGFNNLSDGELADIDGDGDLDAVAYSSVPSEVFWAENLGSGVFASTAVIPTDGTTVLDLDVADMDGDGVPDLLLGVANADEVAVWLRNLGNATFAPAESIATSGPDFDSAISLAARDLTGDGDLDVVLADLSDQTVAWVQNLGLGNFAPAVLLSSEINQPRFVATGDLSGNGNPDVLVTSLIEGLSWFPNLGTPTGAQFLALSQSAGPQVGSNSVDIFVTGFSLGSAALQFGTSSMPVTIQAGGKITIAIPEATAAGPVDLTLTQGNTVASLPAGYTYLAPTLGNSSPGAVAWYESETFSLSATNLQPGLPASVTIGDLVTVPAVVTSPTQATFELPADQLPESLSYDLTLTQGSVVAELEDALAVFPRLNVFLTGSVTQGAQASINVISSNTGLAYVLSAASTTPTPVAFTEIHGILRLDLASVSILATGPTPGFPLPTTTIPPGLIAPGTQVALQGLVAEVTPQGTLLGFTQALTVTLQ